MRYLIFLLASTCIIAVSCKKNKDKPQPPAPPETGETVRVRLNLAGDLQLSESALPWERRAGNMNEYAKTLRDSTIYAVIVNKHGEQPWTGRYSSGLFNRLDSVVLDLPLEVKVDIIVRAFKKGSGGGLFYTWRNGMQYFDLPMGTELTNKMDTLHRTTTAMVDTVSWMKVTDPLDTLQYIGGKDFPELDVYYGKVTYTALPAPTSIQLKMKRICFGLQLSSNNFTAGKLIAEIPYAQAATVTPANINTKHFIYASDFFKTDSAFSLPVTVKWEKPGGSVVTLGEKTIQFKRNVLTKIQVVVSDSGKTQLELVITETDWGGTEFINF